MSGNVTAVIPHIPVRPHQLANAVDGVAGQTVRVRAISIAVDVERLGSAATRNRALDAATTEWVAFLDDDDRWYPNHIETLLTEARATGADVVYPGCDVFDAEGRPIPLREEWGRFGQSFNPALLLERSYIPVTSLVRTELAQRARFGPPKSVDTDYDDWGFYVRLLEMRASFIHVPRVTWAWHHNGLNTSGRADRW